MTVKLSRLSLLITAIGLSILALAPPQSTWHPVAVFLFGWLWGVSVTTALIGQVAREIKI